jgi:hypothetical protein
MLVTAITGKGSPIPAIAGPEPLGIIASSAVAPCWMPAIIQCILSRPGWTPENGCCCRYRCWASGCRRSAWTAGSVRHCSSHRWRSCYYVMLAHERSIQKAFVFNVYEMSFTSQHDMDSTTNISAVEHPEGRVNTSCGVSRLYPLYAYPGHGVPAGTPHFAKYRSAFSRTSGRCDRCAPGGHCARLPRTLDTRSSSSPTIPRARILLRRLASRTCRLLRLCSLAGIVTSMRSLPRPSVAQP